MTPVLHFYLVCINFVLICKKTTLFWVFDKKTCLVCFTLGLKHTQRVLNLTTNCLEAKMHFIFKNNKQRKLGNMFSNKIKLIITSSFGPPKLLDQCCLDLVTIFFTKRINYYIFKKLNSSFHR